MYAIAIVPSLGNLAMVASPVTAPAATPSRTARPTSASTLALGGSGISSPTAPSTTEPRARSTVNVNRTSGTATHPHRRASWIPSATSTDGETSPDRAARETVGARIRRAARSTSAWDSRANVHAANRACASNARCAADSCAHTALYTWYAATDAAVNVHTTTAIVTRNRRIPASTGRVVRVLRRGGH